MNRRPVVIAILTYAMLSWQFSCTQEPALSSPCGAPATIVAGDGCGFNFQLDDGTRLYPYITGCEDVYAAYRPPDQIGRRVSIGFRERSDVDISCNNAIAVDILCIEDEESIH